VSDTIRVAVPEAPPAGAEAGEAPKKRPQRRRDPEPVPAPEAEDEKAEPRLISSNRPMRFLVVHSDALLRRFDESLAAKLDRQREAVEKRARATLGEGFACRADALAAAARLDGIAEWLKVEAEAVEVTERVKLARPGRPKKDELPEFKTRFEVQLKLEPDEAAIADARRRAGCFVLISDWTVDQRPDADILAEYRHQALVEGHTGFRWLKGPGAVAPVFLETPTRIRALGLVLVLALMVRNFIQFRLRREMAAQKKPVLHPLRKKADDHLTTEMALLWFAGQVSTLVQMGDGPAVRGRVKLGDEAKKVLELLGFSVDIYARPPPR
jgi:transposase